MRPLSASELLDIWEQGLTLSPPRRALLLLTAACPDQLPENLALQSIGWRDASLLALRGLAFGSQFESLAACPACDERVELAFDAAQVRVSPNSDPSEGVMEIPGGWRFRLPNSLDLLYLAEGSILDADQAQRALLQRCLMLGDGEQPPPELPESDARAVIVQMAEADPQADINISLSCPACTHTWSMRFDILTFFWREIDAWARRLLLDIHVLARSYGWREADILALTAWRRQAYVGMARV